MRKLKETLAVAILLAQVAGIVAGRFSHESFWSWVPHDNAVAYDMRVVVRGEELAPRKVFERYGLLHSSLRFDTPEDVMAVVRLHESRHPAAEAQVELVYWVNGKDGETWRWPEP